ncbi:AAA family ATPase [Candidatus Enterococcus clewellii]|uniref:Uncharacterized protein n=1 Tax=Candidatus Enterococcus clewellii TaxID=1834193 RepID=A0A242JW56_9ENTE|nr:AAA family ATPase [Enterococcus sp. 9E7_DIV0242]OTP06740.1 hypothetical protein A5888_004195 [Enterococcus sp. 9E7_DIV0242]
MEQFNTGAANQPQNSLLSLWDRLPVSQPHLVTGLLKKFNIMALCGPSKSCKTSAAIQLSAAVAEGNKWLGWQCQHGKVLYINLDNDEISTMSHFKKVYSGLNMAADHLANITIHTLKGEKFLSFGSFVDSIIEFVANEQYTLVVIDPIDYLIDLDKGDPYQLITFDQELNRLVKTFGCSLVYTHSVQREVKGNKEMKKIISTSSLLRLCDAYIELVELEPTSSLSWSVRNSELVQLYGSELLHFYPAYYDENISEALPELFNWHYSDFEPHIDRIFTEEQKEALKEKADHLAERLDHRTAWRTIIITKDFPPIKDREYWFDYPIHKSDDSNLLSDLEPGHSLPLWKTGERSRKPKESKVNERAEKLKAAVEQFNDANQAPPSINDIAAILDKSPRTIRNWVNEFENDYIIKGGIVFLRVKMLEE